MNKQLFSLIPFPAPKIPDISISGEISLQDHTMSLNYVVSRKIEEVLLPAVSLSRSRKDDLWKMTCFEFFLAVKDQPQYWEFNMSPSGDWNVYYMDAYRRVGFREETSIQRLSFEMRTGTAGISLDTLVDLNLFLPPDQTLEFGISAIIQTRNGQESYWALAHPGREADFHLRDSFTLGLAEQTHLSQQSALDD
jgi:hypothetical protein